MRASEFITESWSKKYKKSIDCSHPRGFSQRAHCAGRKAGKKTKSASVSESLAKAMSTADMIAYLRQHHDKNLHQDYLNYINRFDTFELRDVPINSIKTDLPKLEKEKVEKYRQMDFGTAPPIVMGDGYILDGFHRANAAKSLGIPNIKAYVGIKKSLKENFADGKKPGRKGLAKRSGVDCKQSASKLRSVAKHSTGEKQRMAHWCANMKSGKKK